MPVRRDESADTVDVVLKTLHRQISAE